MFAGIDLGTSLIKMITGANEHDRNPLVNPYGFSGQDLFEDNNAQKLASKLADEGIKTVCLTGSQAERFAPIAAAAGLNVHASELSAVDHELHMQAQGVRQLLAEQGRDPNEFLLVSIGTGTSFTLITKDADPRQFIPGLSIGGRTLERLALIRDVQPHRIGSLAMYGKDPDLLMKHLYPDAGMLKGQFVLATMGRLGADDEPQTIENYCYGLIKMIATVTMGHIMIIRQVEGFKWDGPVVFIGTPVNEYRLLQSLLLKFCAATGMTALFPKNGNLTAALGAYYSALSGDNTQIEPPPVTLLTKARAQITYYAGLLKALTR